MACISYVLAAIALCIALGWLAARITASQLLDQAQQQLACIENGQPLWHWRLQRPHDLIAGRAFGNARLARDGGMLAITSMDGTAFELGLPIAWSLDLAHWPILELSMQSDAHGTLGLVRQDNETSACVALAAAPLTPGMRVLRLDMRQLSWRSAQGMACPAPGVVRMLRLRVQIPAGTTLRIASAALLAAEPIPHAQNMALDLPAGATEDDVEHIATRAQTWPAPVFRLPAGISADRMLALRDQLRAHWPAALIVPAGANPQAARPARSYPLTAWAACVVYWLALAGLLLNPIKGPLRPWLEVAGCLGGPLWLVIGLHWGLHPSLSGMFAFAGGLAFALAIERRHLPRLWRWPATWRVWLWPLAPVPVAAGLIIFWGHRLQPLAPVHAFTYFGWAWLQQWLMLVVLMQRFERMGPRPGWAVIAIATTFALLHTPNGLLMQCCFVAELWWARCFLRSRTVLPIALAHAACALLAESGLVGGTLRSLEVSARFFL
ncbi:hypothetical protein GCM10027066_25040 [Dyella jejuensis]